MPSGKSSFAGRLQGKVDEKAAAKAAPGGSSLASVPPGDYVCNVYDIEITEFSTLEERKKAQKNYDYGVAFKLKFVSDTNGEPLDDALNGKKHQNGVYFDFNKKEDLQKLTERAVKFCKACGITDKHFEKLGIEKGLDAAFVKIKKEKPNVVCAVVESEYLDKKTKKQKTSKNLFMNSVFERDLNFDPSSTEDEANEVLGQGEVTSLDASGFDGEEGLDIPEELSGMSFAEIGELADSEEENSDVAVNYLDTVARANDLDPDDADTFPDWSTLANSLSDSSTEEYADDLSSVTNSEGIEIVIGGTYSAMDDEGNYLYADDGETGLNFTVTAIKSEGMVDAECDGSEFELSIESLGEAW